MTVPQPWPPPGSLTDERLAFLVVEAEIRRKSKPWWITLIRILRGRQRSHLMEFRNGSGGGGMHNELSSDLMMSYVLAVDSVAQRLTSEERLELRATGTLPPAFMPTVEALRKKR